MSDFSQSEDIVFILETSPDFYKTDMSPNRFLKFQALMKQFIEERIELDYRDRYLIIFFNNSVTIPMGDYDNFGQSLIEKLNFEFNKPESTTPTQHVQAWANNLASTLQKAIQKGIGTFKQIRNKTLRIIVIANQLLETSKDFNSKIQTIIERTAQRLDIIIDSLFITGSKNVSVFDYENPYKLIASMTGGKYFQIKNTYDLEEAFKKIVKKKNVLRKDYMGEREYSQEKQFLEVIASEMEKVTDLLDDAQLKCNVCFKVECSDSTLDKYEHIRQCPNCKKIIHLCCAGRWAEQQNTKSNFIGFPNVFRCPYCFYLLKVPREFVNFDVILHQLQEKWLKQKEIEDREKQAEMAKEKATLDFISEVEDKESKKEKIIKWLTERVAGKSPRDIERIAKDIINLPNEEEQRSFIDYLKFKENIDDDSVPF